MIGNRIAFLLFSALVSLCACSLIFEKAQADAGCPAPWHCSQTEIPVRTWGIIFTRPVLLTPSIRSGYVTENPDVPFRGNVIYYQGLGDSMLNHLPLFRLLAGAGYRVIAFDYMGQGGSSGEMNDTRIVEIVQLGDKAWKLHARDLVTYPKKTIIGWSTGGLAAYIEAALLPDSVSNVVLIAPGIVPNKVVGETDLLRGKINRITLPSLTTARYESGTSNPHIDLIFPESPLDVPWFALDLLKIAGKARRISVPRKTNGLVLLSGPNDTYVDAEQTRKVLTKRAPHFQINEYPRALHEIDNEAEPFGSAARNDILNFILRN